MNEPRDAANLRSERLAMALRGAAGQSVLPKPVQVRHQDGQTLAIRPITGPRLDEAWSSPEISEGTRVDWLVALCRGLEALEAAGCCAGGLLPSMVTVTKNGPVIADLSTFVFPADDRTDADASTAMADAHIPPEILRGDPMIEPSAANAYTLGTLIGALVLGRTLEDADLREDGLRPIRELVATVSPEVEDVLQRATHRDPAMRSSSSLLAETLAGMRALLGIRLVPGAATNIGLGRLTNEDRYVFAQAAKQSPEGEASVVMAAVADGIGGSEGGEVASKLALEAVESTLRPRLDRLLGTNRRRSTAARYGQFLQRGATEADQAIRRYGAENPFYNEMGTTLAVALLVGGQAYVGNSGDSRVYIVGPGGIRQISRDHTIVAESVLAGNLSAAEAQVHPDRRHLTRAVGYGDPVLFLTGAMIGEGETLLLCSDGLTEAVPEAEIAEVFERIHDPETACRQLVHLANLVGGPDNITVVAVRRVPRLLFGALPAPGEAIHCYQCGALNIATANACSGCGNALVRPDAQVHLSRPGMICPSCNAVNPGDSQSCATCGWLLPAPPGTEIDARYRVVRMLGQGGMGRAYLVNDLVTHEHRVLKELIRDTHSTPAQDALYERYFRNEADVQSRLRALRAVPNFLEPVEEADGRLYFVMEYVPGESLSRLMGRLGIVFSWQRVRAWAIELCDVLTFLHRSDPEVFIVHRDIAPDNIQLRGADPETSGVVLMDFGLARMARNTLARTPGLGRQGYAAPEQLLGRAEPRSDLFSLAATMYYLLVGQDANATAPVRPLEPAVAPGVPQWLGDIIGINLQEDATRRYPSASRLRDDLERATVSLTVRCPACGRENPNHLTHCRDDGTTLSR